MGEVESSGKKRTTTTLAPGFRFHPTDEELVWYYLRRKVSGRRFSLDAISEIDIYKVEPTDLPGLSKLKTRDKEWYFFSALDRKYGNGMRTNRATCDGYWKTTGKDRPVYHDNQVVGMKKTLVYHFGRAPRGKRTDWVMHEYKLVDEQLDKAGYPLEGYVLCRIFRKSGTGPKNGEKYGAPLVEAEWEDNEAENVITSDVSFEDPYVDDDFIEHNDLVKDLDLQFPEGAPLLANFDSQGSQNYVEEHNDIPEGVPPLDNFDSQGRQDYVEECKDVVAPAGIEHGSQAYNDKDISDLYAQANSNADAVKNEYMPQLNGEFNEASVNLSHEPSPNGVGDTDDLFFDPGDFLNLAEENPLDYGSFGSWSDGLIDIEAILKDSPPEPGADIDQSFTFEQDLDDAFFNMPLSSNQLPVSIDAGIGSSSSKTLGGMMDKQSRTALSMPNRWLENIPAHQAFASEMPSKDMASRLSEAASSVQVTAGMVRIRDMSSGLRWSFDKTGSVNVLLSFELPQALGHEELCPSKLPAAVSRGWLCFMFFWVTLFALSIKIGTCIYAK